jgi:hypothetical protein
VGVGSGAVAVGIGAVVVRIGVGEGLEAGRFPDHAEQQHSNGKQVSDVGHFYVPKDRLVSQVVQLCDLPVVKRRLPSPLFIGWDRI